MSLLTYAFKTDRGRVRELNQDSLAVLAPAQLNERADGLFVVADGMGGAKGGEIASRLAVEAVTAVITTGLNQANEAEGPDALDAQAFADTVQAGLCAANTSVWNQAQQVRAQRGMGTTCVLALVTGGALLVGNVGDSRCYLLRGKRLRQLSHDHASLQAGSGGREGEEQGGGRVHFRHVMTRAIGFASVVEPEVEMFALQESDVLLLCSDGLSNLLQDAEIAEILTESKTPQDACARLVSRANHNGGDDNITVIVAHYGAAHNTDSEGMGLEPDAGQDGDARSSGSAQKAEVGNRSETAADVTARVLPWWKKLGRSRKRK